MGELVRSADMLYLQMLIPKEAAIAFADEMGRRDVMMFTDLNAHVQMFERNYIKDITRINEASRAFKGLQNMYLEFRLLSEDDLDVSPDILMRTPRDNAKTIYEITDSIREFYRQLSQQVMSFRTLTNQSESLQNQLEVLNSLDTFLEDAPALKPNTFKEDMKDVDVEDVRFKFLAGICPSIKVGALRKQIYLITRGNRYFKSEPLEQNPKKHAFVVFFIGEYSRNLIKKFCQWMDVDLFLDSTEQQKSSDVASEVERKIKEHSELLEVTKNEITRIMRSHKPDVLSWSIQLKQELAIRVLLNRFKERNDGGLLLAEGWIPISERETVDEVLAMSQVGTKAVGIVEEIAGKGKKPTYFEINKFTEVFYELIDTYGTPENGEYNPTVPSIVTFPFLFSMMYGDMFHGSMMLSGALWLIFNEKKNAQSKDEFVTGLHYGRYLILLMGMFAIFNGFIYNDCAALSWNLFNGSQWENVRIPGDCGGRPFCDVDYGKATGVYSFGIDPVWQKSKNQLSYSNSLKMKLSVIVGISQMTFGLFIKLSNEVYFGDWLSICTEFVPQMCYMIGFFNYMQFIIIYKWMTDWGGRTAPQLITLLVNMVLHPGQIDPSTQLFEDANLQANVQFVMLTLFLGSIPVMFLLKPMILFFKIRAARDRGENPAHIQGIHHEGDDELSFMNDVLIIHMIHQIEYCLGCVSHTASYLRLWALSLAHSQLAEVFYEKCIVSGYTGSPMLMFVCCALFLCCTFAVLMCMDVLECFLHALRLHWVEFQTKFYGGQGEKFLAFSYGSFIKE